MLEPQTKPGEVRNRKRVNAEIVDGTKPETPVVKRKIKPTPPAVPAAATPRLLRPATSKALQAVAHGQLEAAQQKETTGHQQEAAAQREQAPPPGKMPPVHKLLGLEMQGQRIRIVIPPGRTRPVQPKIASKYATACSVAVNAVVPIFPHWKDYKERPDVFSGFARHLSVSFVTQLSSSFHCCS